MSSFALALPKAAKEKKKKKHPLLGLTNVQSRERLALRALDGASYKEKRHAFKGSVIPD